MSPNVQRVEPFLALGFVLVCQVGASSPVPEYVQTRVTLEARASTEKIPPSNRPADKSVWHVFLVLLIGAGWLKLLLLLQQLGR